MPSIFHAHALVRIGTALSAAVLLIALSACGPSQSAQAPSDSASDSANEPPPALVRVVQVQAQQVQRWDSFNGRIAAPETVELRPRVDGYIDSLGFSEGQLVQKGQVLFRIDPRPYRAALASAQAQLKSAQAAATLAKTQNQRARDLVADRAISLEEADTRAGTLAQALANVQAAEAAVVSAQLALNFTEVRAPITGLAGRALLTVGNLAQANQSVLTNVVSQNPVFVYFDVDEQSLLRSKAAAGVDHSSAAAAAGVANQAGQVRVALSGEQDFSHPGLLSFSDNQLDPQTGTIRLRATLDNAQGLFTPGMFARVQMQAGPSVQAVLIDDKAILTDQDRQYAYVVGPDQRAERRDLKLGRMVQGQRLVEAGLAPGDTLVVLGMQRIFYPGMRLAPQPLADDAAATGNVNAEAAVSAVDAVDAADATGAAEAAQPQS